TGGGFFGSKLISGKLGSLQVRQRRCFASYCPTSRWPHSNTSYWRPSSNRTLRTTARRGAPAFVTRERGEGSMEVVAGCARLGCSQASVAPSRAQLGQQSNNFPCLLGKIQFQP